MKVFAFGGLGVDKKVFENFHIDADLIVIEWLIPDKNEPFDHYISRIALLISTSEPFGLIGVSFGGIVAVELAKRLKPQFTIIISSVASREELPLVYRFVGGTNILKFIPAAWIKAPSPIMNHFFGVKKESDKAFLSSIIGNTPKTFLKWAISCIATWKNKEVPKKLYRIHGNRDKILPIVQSANNLRIEAAGHFMIVTHSRQITELINDKIIKKR